MSRVSEAWEKFDELGSPSLRDKMLANEMTLDDSAWPLVQLNRSGGLSIMCRSNDGDDLSEEQTLKLRDFILKWFPVKETP